jgi:ferrous iron transport protein A
VAASEQNGPGSSRPALGARGTRSLGEVATGETVTIQKVDLPAETVGWLAAVGLERGEEITVLRKAILGGPLHLRLARGGELAVARDVALRVVVEDT